MNIKTRRWLISVVTAMALAITTQANANLINNGDFSTGNNAGVNFSDYSYVSTPGPSALVPEGTYAIGNNPHDWHSLWSGSVVPQDGSNGYMMIVNGAITHPSNQNYDIVWQQTITNINQNTLYDFSAWATSIYNAETSPANLNFYVNGVLLLNSSFILGVGNQVGVWQNFMAQWYSGNATSATIAIVDTNNIATGNDFALDTLSFDRSAVPEPATLLLFGTGLLGLVGLRKKNK